MKLKLDNSLHQKIWNEVEKRMTGKGKKNYVLHSAMVTRAMQDIMKGEGGDPDVMIPAAMLHDIGLIKILKEKWYPKTTEEKQEYEVLHITYAVDVVPEILKPLGYTDDQITEIIRVVQSHKSKDPAGDNSVACMVDADNLSDIYSESFYSDAKFYGNTPQETYEFRSKNTFFTKTANEVFKQELEERRKEIDEENSK